ncbi:MAG: dihydrolipoyl dehydrogenase [Candidatus Neomarinimicrobiota bacterium]|nr:MAG: dihydrolipoyl dehydrogenase [Candidatus Neomarinimicrobiota bacterium]
MSDRHLHHNVVVVGSGPGGYAAAFRAADLGKDVLLIEKDDVLGGVCLNRGCIPSKALLHVARVIAETRELADKGVTFTAPTIDLPSLVQWKQSVVGQLNQGIARMAQARNVTTLQGTARFSSDRELQVDTDSGPVRVTFDDVIIAAGSRPALIPGLPASHPRVITSTGALNPAEIPGRLLIIGGGYIGLEMGTVYSALGSEVSVVEFMDSLLPGADPDLVRPLTRKLKREFSAILLKTRVVDVKPGKGDRLDVTFEGPQGTTSQTFDTVLVSVGRRPNTDSLGLDHTSIRLTERGHIAVDNRQRTNVPHVYAIGDIAGDPMLAHKATHEGKVAAEVIAGLPAAFDARAIPAVIFTDPEIAWTGLTETRAKADQIPYAKGEFPWGASGRSLALGRKEGKTKILFDPDTKRVLGAGVVGPGAGELIAEATLAIEMGADAEDLGLTIHAHPTLSETVANAAEVFTGTVTDLYVPRKK